MQKYIICLCLIASIYSVSIDAAVKYLKSHAKPHSVHLYVGCVAAALHAGGFKFKNQDAPYQYRTNGILKSIGYREIPKPSSFKKGDITITENNSAHKYGHMAMYTGKQWISDFKLRSEFVYDKKTQPPVHYYRYDN